MPVDKRTGRGYSGRGWSVVNKRINASRQICERCGHNTSIVTLESGRFCTWCFKNDPDYHFEIMKTRLTKIRFGNNRPPPGYTMDLMKPH